MDEYLHGGKKNGEFHVGQQWKNANAHECILNSEIFKENFIISELFHSSFTNYSLFKDLFSHVRVKYRWILACDSECVYFFLLDVSRIVDFHHPYLELILLVFGALVKGSVISESPDVIELVEAFDVVRHSISLQHILTLRDGGYSVDLQVWKQSEVKEKGKRERESDKRKHCRFKWTGIVEWPERTWGESQGKTRTHTGRLVKCASVFQ